MGSGYCELKRKDQYEIEFLKIATYRSRQERRRADQLLTEQADDEGNGGTESQQENSGFQNRERRIDSALHSKLDHGGRNKCDIMDK